MNIKGFKIIKDNIIEFSTKAGIGVGTWYRDTAEDDAKREHSIEFTIDQPLMIGTNAVIMTGNKKYFVSHDGRSTEFHGKVDGVDEDGLIYFRLGFDCLMMIENEDPQIKKGDWLSITLPVEYLRVFSIGSRPL